MVKVSGTSKTSPKWLAARPRLNRGVHEAMKGLNKKWRKWEAQWEERWGQVDVGNGAGEGPKILEGCGLRGTFSFQALYGRAASSSGEDQGKG